LFDTSFEVAAKEAGIYNPNKIYSPERVVMGSGLLIPDLEEALLGMKEGETKNVRIPPDKVYGMVIRDSIRTFPKEGIDNYQNLKINDVVTVVAPNGNSIFR